MSVDKDKVLVADAAYDFPLAHLPKDCRVVLRYVGKEGQTPHLVTLDAIAAIRKSGRVWAPIWTPTNDVFSHQLGVQAANEMLAALKRYPMIGPEPVFLDIEKHVYDSDPHGCMAGVESWQQGMHAAGHHQAYAYLPAQAQTQWVADWVGVAPHHFAPGVIGVQYTGSGPSGGEYDLSVVLLTVFAPLLNAGKGGRHQATGDRAFLVAQLDQVQHNLAKLIRTEAADLAAELTKATAPNVAALADAITAKLGPQLAGDLADLLAKRLSR